MAESPTPLNVYGYMVVYRHSRDQKWQVDQDDEYLNLPAHYSHVDEALDRVEYLRTKSIESRVAALVAESTDTVEEFKENKADGSQDPY
jgi:hypothetical protein